MPEEKLEAIVINLQKRVYALERELLEVKDEHDRKVAKWLNKHNYRQVADAILAGEHLQ